MSVEQFDYIVVGGGTAGSVLASRLSADPGIRVLLLEAGVDATEQTTPEEIRDGVRPWRPRVAGGSYFWPDFNILRAAAFPGVPREPQFYEQGKILGGGSAINMVVSNRGLPRDYDEWARLGATGWDWAGILPYFRKLEDDPEFHAQPGGTDLHGLGGPIPIVRVPQDRWTALTRAATVALEAHGLENLRDQNGRFTDGYFPPTFTVRNGERVSAARGYLDDRVRLRPNLSLWTETQVLGLVVEGKRVTGVEVRRGGATSKVLGAEVILAAGALQTPALLLRAGIGPGAEFRDLGIPVLADRPGVGKNLWDHSSLGLVAPLTPAAREAVSDVRATTMHQLGIRVSSGVDPSVPSDLFLHLGADPGTDQATTVLWINKPSSHGQVRLRDAHPDSLPQVDFNLLSDPRDLLRLRRALEFANQWFQHPALAGYGLQWSLSRFAAPQPGGPLLQQILADQDALDTYLRTHVGGVWHASGTARIGRPDDPLAVVDPAGRVYGVDGLRVADASVMPTVPAANTNLPTLAIAEKISATLLAGRRVGN